MAWDYFHGWDRPELIDYVADRDLWTWCLPNSSEISAVLASHEHDWETWSDLAEKLEYEESRSKIIDEGAASYARLKRT